MRTHSLTLPGLLHSNSVGVTVRFSGRGGVPVSVCVCVRVHACVRTRMCVWLCVRAGVYTCMNYTCTCIYMYICTCQGTNVHVADARLHVHVHVCVLSYQHLNLIPHTILLEIRLDKLVYH